MNAPLWPAPVFAAVSGVLSLHSDCIISSGAGTSCDFAEIVTESLANLSVLQIFYSKM